MAECGATTRFSTSPQEHRCVLEEGHEGNHETRDADSVTLRLWPNYEKLGHLPPKQPAPAG